MALIRWTRALRLAPLLGALAVSACTRAGFGVAHAGARADSGGAEAAPGGQGDGAAERASSPGVTFQGASQSGPCESECNKPTTTHHFAHGLAAGRARLLVTFVGCGENGLGASVSYGGVPMRRLGGIVSWESFGISGELFFVAEDRLQALANAPHELTMLPGCYAGILMQFSGVDQANPIDSYVGQGTQNNTAHTIQVVTADTKAMIVSGMSAGHSSDRLMSVPATSAGQVLRGSVQYPSSSGGGYAASTRPWQGSSTSMTFEMASDPYPFAIHVGAAIHPAP